MTTPIFTLSISDLRKTYGPTVALAGVDLVCRAGEIVALMGANGAGKSTLVKILCGLVAADHGAITLGDRMIAPKTPAEAQEIGIVAVHQAIADVGVPTLSVAENLLLDRFCSGSSTLFAGPAALRKAAAPIAAAIGLDIDLAARLDSVSLADRQMIAIARAVARRPAVLLFDEPTASLSAAEAERLFTVIERLRDSGVVILYISHKTADLRRLADRVVVLRDGRVAGAFAKPLDFDAALSTMIGRSLAAAVAHRPPPAGNIVFSLRNARLRRSERPFGLEVHAGEVVAVTGPVGSGKTSLAGTMFGLWPLTQGSMTLDGQPWRPAGPADAIAQGVFYAGEDRWRTSFFPASVPFASIAGTLSFPFLRARSRGGFVSTRDEIALATRAIAEFGIKAPGPRARLTALSGGNQQKVVLARWGIEPARLLLLDEPFQGVDVGARTDIIRAIRARSAGRATIVFVNDYEEALEVGDRIVALDDHTSVALDDHTSVALDDHTSVALDDHTSVALDDHTIVALDDHTIVAFDDHTSVAFDDHTSVAFDDHTSVAFDDHTSVAFDDHTSVAFDDHTSVAFDDHAISSPRQHVPQPLSASAPCPTP